MSVTACYHSVWNVLFVENVSWKNKVYICALISSVLPFPTNSRPRPWFWQGKSWKKCAWMLYIDFFATMSLLSTSAMLRNTEFIMALSNYLFKKCNIYFLWINVFAKERYERECLRVGWKKKKKKNLSKTLRFLEKECANVATEVSLNKTYTPADGLFSWSMTRMGMNVNPFFMLKENYNFHRSKKVMEKFHSFAWKAGIMEVLFWIKIFNIFWSWDLFEIINRNDPILQSKKREKGFACNCINQQINKLHLKESSFEKGKSINDCKQKIRRIKG